MRSNVIDSSAGADAPLRGTARRPRRIASWLVLLASAAFASLALADDIETLKILDDVFGDLLLGLYGAAAFGAVVGFAVHVWRRRRLRAYPGRWGLAAAVIVAALALWGANAGLSTLQSERCSSEVLDSSEAASDYDRLCREYRELPANAIGSVDGYRILRGLDRRGNVVALTPFMVRFHGYAAVVVLAALGFGALFFLHLVVGRPLTR